MSVLDRVYEEGFLARPRVRHIMPLPTPLTCLFNNGAGYEIYVKREDLGPINAYKWRGAYNAMEHYVRTTGAKVVVAASAGNHAQGVALAAKMLDVKAQIFMPQTAPEMKQRAVKYHGGENVEIILHGDSFNDAAAKAREHVEKTGHQFIHPFDDLYTIAGQATIGDEIVLSEHGPFDYAFCQIGGGGMAAGVSTVLRSLSPKTKLIGVEGVDQASMKASVDADEITTLGRVDTFCDGTAVMRPGNLTYAICRENFGKNILTVTNDEVAAAMKRTWDAARFIPEPSGAMGLAGLINYAENNPDEVQGKKLLCVITGANMDFSTLGKVASRSAVGAHKRRYIEFHIDEKSGGLLNVLETYCNGLNVSEFLYGKVDREKAYPIIGIDADPHRMIRLADDLKRGGVAYADVTDDVDVCAGNIPYNPFLFKNPILTEVQFPERKGALRDLMGAISGVSNVCYFRYASSGEAVGSALMGFEFETPEDKTEFFKKIGTLSGSIQCRPVPETVERRMLGHRLTPA